MSELPIVPSPYEGQRLRASTHLQISSLWFGANFLWGALLLILLPVDMERLYPKNPVPAAGLLLGFGAIFALVVPLLVGALSDRCASHHGRRKPFIAVGLLVTVVGLALMLTGYQNISLALYVLGFVVVQSGSNISSAAFSGIIPDVVPGDQRGIASGYMAVMSQMGTVLGAFGTGFALGHASQQMRYALVMGVLLVFGLVTLVGVRENPLPFKPPLLNWKEYFKSLWIDPKKFPDFAWVWITRALVMFGFYTLPPFIQSYLRDVPHSQNPKRDASLMMAVILIGSAISGLAGGYVSERIGRKPVIYWASAIMAGMALVLAAMQSLTAIFFVGILFGIGYGAYVSVDWALGADVLPTKSNAAKEMAVWHVAMTLPQSIAAPFAGLLISFFGRSTESAIVDGKLSQIVHYTHNGYASMFILAAISFTFGGIFLKNVRGVK